MIIYDRDIAKKVCELDNDNMRIAMEVCDLLIEGFKKWDGKCYNKRVGEDLEEYVINNLKENNGVEECKNRIMFSKNCWNNIEIVFAPSKTYITNLKNERYYPATKYKYIYIMPRLEELLNGKRIDNEKICEYLEKRKEYFKRYIAKIEESLKNVDELFVRKDEILKQIIEYNDEVGYLPYFDLGIRKNW